MGICNSLEIFQEKMNKMFRGLDFIREYIDNLLLITKGDWYDQLNKLERALQNIKFNKLNCNIEKSFFGKTQMEYLGFWVTRNGIRPVNRKVEAIVNMTPPNNIIQVHVFVGLVNYYMDMWSRR